MKCMTGMPILKMLCFNKAANRNSRKFKLADRRGRSRSASIKPRIEIRGNDFYFDRITQEANASIKPRIEIRGNRKLDFIEKLRFVASIKPRIEIRGNAIYARAAQITAEMLQ